MTPWAASARWVRRYASQETQRKPQIPLTVSVSGGEPRKAYKTNRKFLLPISMSDVTVRHSDRAIPLNRKANCVMPLSGTVLEVDLDIRG